MYTLKRKTHVEKKDPKNPHAPLAAKAPSLRPAHGGAEAGTQLFNPNLHRSLASQVLLPCGPTALSGPPSWPVRGTHRTTSPVPCASSTVPHGLAPSKVLHSASLPFCEFPAAPPPRPRS